MVSQVYKYSNTLTQLDAGEMCEMCAGSRSAVPGAPHGEGGGSWEAPRRLPAQGTLHTGSVSSRNLGS